MTIGTAEQNALLVDALGALVLAHA